MPRIQPVRPETADPRTEELLVPTNPGLNRATDYSTVFLRIALGISFLSAVADRFGLWGAYGQPNVAWGEFSRFVAYTLVSRNRFPTAEPCEVASGLAG
jgi:hypothetical protein